MGELRERTPDCTARLRVLLLCSPCMGHLIPFTELARRLVADHGLAATLLYAAATSPPSEQYLALAASVPDGVDVVALPAPPADALPFLHAPSRARRARRELQRPASPGGGAGAVGGGAARRARGGHGRRAGARRRGRAGRPVLHVLHLAVDDLVPAPAPPGAGATRAGEYRDATESIRLPGCVPIHAHELPPSMLADRSSDRYAGFLSMANEMTGFDGVLVNTFRELEPAVGDVMNGLELPVHPVGPLVWTRPVAMDRMPSV